MPACSRLGARVLARHRHGASDSQDHVERDGGTRMAGGTPEEQILRQRLDRIADLARRMVERARVNPQAPAFGLVGELVRIAEDAEG